MNIKTQNYLKQLDDQFELVKKVENEEIRSMLAQYLCIRTSGLLETFIKSRISDYVQGRVPKEVNRYISGKIKDITNLKCTKLEDVLKSFSNEWAKDFNSDVEEHEQQKNSVDSLVTNRHNIAHGQNGNISFKNLEQYYNDVKAIIKTLDTIIS
ncbi:MAG: hypothetical protein K2I86_02925 [Prevotella sp.]|nr:hypothetical protein [Prevotella sp.]